MRAVIVNEDALVRLAMTNSSALRERIAFRAALFADAEGVATFPHGSLRVDVGYRNRGTGELFSQDQVDRAIGTLISFGILLPGSTAERLVVNTSVLNVIEVPEGLHD